MIEFGFEFEDMIKIFKSVESQVPVSFWLVPCLGGIWHQDKGPGDNYGASDDTPLSKIGRSRVV